ncbi:MAG: metal-dependent transcriptional regulator [Fretibacterium sp.]|uniref:metal-dependent transcriptional regulator n=1 Tax=Fretibacterium sp. OH1220_COT-178 TaxID=2491047 RepID=UPI000F5E11B2|nr:metal-dependent transcriptional regulator [Fretibacterium sp. OH1220_COT-178]MDO4785467.1 metal-dependent transcriptional regulator [Fretibacterium sp.]RRD66056.1 metal-dependent transcriptional regulator [Fretibacterium sp. OH1220_COT-178]
MITARIEDYLEELFLLESTGRTVTVTDLAERLKITKGTVTATVQKLVDQGFLNHERYGALHLTDSGRRKGLVVFRRHEGLRAFFHELLGLDREQSSEMACCMEHYIDTITEERLYALLEYFRRARAEREPWVDEAFVALEKPILLPLPLTLSQEGAKGQLIRLTADEPLRKRLMDSGFTSGTSVTLLQVKDGNYTVQVKRRSLDLPLNEAATVWILAS